MVLYCDGDSENVHFVSVVSMRRCHGLVLIRHVSLNFVHKYSIAVACCYVLLFFRDWSAEIAANLFEVLK